MGLSTSIPADVSAIERELQRQWQDRASGEPVVRTRTLNLVIVSRRNAVSPDLTTQLTEVHPCRAILVDLSSAVSNFRAQVSSSCTLAHPGAICLAREEVRLRAPLEIESGRVESIIVPLLLSDLPNFLWWYAEPDVDHPLFTRLAPHFDRIILDSAESADPWLGLAALRRVILDRRWSASIADLAWSRVTTWRELTAQFFDNRQCAEYSTYIRVARIADGTGDHISSDAVLFAAWIARQLAWRSAGVPTPKQHEYRIPLQREGSACEVQLTRRYGAGHGIQSLQLITAGEKDATFSIEQTPDYAGLITTTRLGTQQQVQRTVRSRSLNLAEMLGREISSASRDTLYEQVLSVVAQMQGTAQ